jgi:hypothetical protein
MEGKETKDKQEKKKRKNSPSLKNSTLHFCNMPAFSFCRFFLLFSRRKKKSLTSVLFLF